MSSSEKMPMIPNTLEVSTLLGEDLLQSNVDVLISVLLDVELLIFPPELDAGPACHVALSDAMPIPDKVFIAGNVA
ncbi:rCG44581 [Rattus norvegicus]|uniref:RCG44581 n=1 Tax=Rattus norvegicus TaxID=10116 RepID=A6I4L2_RAT|nr:rCG44581 [Rattus norvegicus]